MLYSKTQIRKGFNMKLKYLDLRLIIATVVLLALVGCDHQTQTTPTQSSIVTQSASSTSSANTEASLLSAIGVDSSAAGGIFSIGWIHAIPPDGASSIVIGQALAVGPSISQTGTQPHGGGVDMGIVTLHAAGTLISLVKHTAPNGGVSYDYAPQPNNLASDSLSYVTDGAYAFNATGSSKFSAFATSLTAPPSLVSITGPSTQQAVDHTNGLTISWSGGFSNGVVLLSLGLAMKPGDNNLPCGPPASVGPDSAAPGSGPGGNGMIPPSGGPGGGTMPPGGGPGGGLNGDSIHVGPPPIGGDSLHLPPPNGDSLNTMPPQGLQIKLSSNTGTYTLTAAELQQLMNAVGTGQAECVVSSTSLSSVAHDGSTVQLVIHCDDRVVFTIK
jgi:hypothetical protein